MIRGSSLNSLRLWIPQLFATLEEATTLMANNATALAEVNTICDLLGSLKAPTSAQLEEAGHVCLPVSRFDVSQR